MPERISSKQKGNILETRFIELASLGSKGELSCFTPDSDDDGIDIIVNRKSQFKPVFFQIKSRYKLNANNSYSQDIGTNTFRENEKFFICFFLFSSIEYIIEQIWLIPSKDFFEKSVELNPKNYKQKLRFTANPKNTSSDKWSQYRVNAKELANRIMKIIDEIYP